MGHAAWGGFPWGEAVWGGLLTTLRERPRARITWLVDVQLLGVGAPLLRFSDKNVVHITDQYHRYIEAITGVGHELIRASSDSLNSPVSITFRNGPWRTFDFLIEAGETYPFEGAPVTVQAVHVADDGDLADAETIFVGVLDEPRAITRRDFTCKASSVEFLADLRR